MFEKKGKTKKFHYGESAHTQWLTEAATEALKGLMKKEKQKNPSTRIGKSYMINKLLEEL